MHPILQRLVYGLIILFLGTQALTIAFLFYSGDSMLIPKWRAIVGILALLALTAAVFDGKDLGTRHLY